MAALVDWPLLKSVSRSFYLTLKLLPGPVRESIALAYLLARLTDTKADGAVTPGEVALLEREADLRRALEASPDREEITTVWRTIQEGQDFDQHRFLPGPGGEPAPPLTADERDRYTYLVAGCVGEFWTILCAKRLPGFSRRPLPEMTALGIRFGQGLQLVNILRDRAADRAIGRVYLPAAEAPAALAQARENLNAAALYTQALRPRRLRAACALPFLIGRETLDLIEAGHPKPKIPRSRVWRLLAASLLY